MSTRLLLAASAATGALLTASPASAHPDPQLPYEYSPEEPTVYREAPVVQPLPSARYEPVERGEYEREYEVEREVRTAPAYRETYRTGGHHPQHGYHHSRQAYPAGYPATYPAHTGYRPQLPAHFDRDEWLAECRENYGDGSGRERGGIIGSLLGAIAGGVVGNRVYDSERLAGTLIGAGVGGLAGLAIGSAIGSSGERRRLDECEATLDRYMAGGYPQYYGPQYGYQPYAYPQYYQMVPVTVAIPQRAVVREYVTYEWVEDERPAPQVIERTRVIERPVKRVPVKRTPVKRVKSIKGG